MKNLLSIFIFKSVCVDMPQPERWWVNVGNVLPYCSFSCTVTLLGFKYDQKETSSLETNPSFVLLKDEGYSIHYGLQPRCTTDTQVHQSLEF